MCWQVLSNKYIYNRLSVLEYIVLWTRCVILVITIANSRPGAPMNSDVAIVGSRWRHNCCHWLWVIESHTDKATTRYETYVMTYVATQSSLDDFPMWIRLDLDPDRVSSDTRSGSKPSLESNLKSRLLVNMAPRPVFLSLALSKLRLCSANHRPGSVTCPVIGRAQPELTPSKRQKMGPEVALNEYHVVLSM